MSRKITTVALILCSLMFSCHKEKKITLSTDLTACPATQECSYFYFENSDLSSTAAITAGNSRIFNYQSISTNECAMTNSLYWAIDLGATQFDIGASELTSNKVVYIQSCPCCDFIAVQPVDGEIKGEKVDATHWLVNFTLKLSSADKKFTSTLAINQYFSESGLSVPGK